MSEISQSWLHDDSPTKHKIVRVIFFLTSFSWTFNSIQDYMDNSTPMEKVMTRMLPMAIVAAYCFTCEHRHLIKRIFRPGLWPLLWYVVFSMFCGISSVQPALCAWKGAEIFITLIYMCVSCRDAESTRKEFVAIINLSEILLWVTVALALVNPTRGFRPSASFIPWLQGYLPILNPNAVGFLSVICVTRLLFFAAEKKPVRLLMAFGTLICAQSRTSYAVVMLAMGIFIIDGLRKKMFGRVIITFFATAIILLLALGWYELILKVVMRGESTEEVASLSGRTNYWEFALRYADWTGNGLATGSRSLIFVGGEVFNKGSVNMHNSYIEALMGGGYIGAGPFLALLVINIIRQGVNTLTRPNVTEGFFLVCAIMFAARGMTSIVLAIFSIDFNNMMLFWFWLYTRNMNSENDGTKPRLKPQPVVYEKTLYEQAAEKDQISCQTVHSV